MALRSVVVILGISKPLVVVLNSSMEDASGVIILLLIPMDWPRALLIPMNMENAMKGSIRLHGQLGFTGVFIISGWVKRGSYFNGRLNEVILLIFMLFTITTFLSEIAGSFFMLIRKKTESKLPARNVAVQK